MEFIRMANENMEDILGFIVLVIGVATAVLLLIFFIFLFVLAITDMINVIIDVISDAKCNRLERREKWK